LNNIETKQVFEDYNLWNEVNKIKAKRSILSPLLQASKGFLRLLKSLSPYVSFLALIIAWKSSKNMKLISESQEDVQNEINEVVLTINEIQNEINSVSRSQTQLQSNLEKVTSSQNLIKNNLKLIDRNQSNFSIFLDSFSHNVFFRFDENEKKLALSESTLKEFQNLTEKELDDMNKYSMPEDSSFVFDTELIYEVIDEDILKKIKNNPLDIENIMFDIFNTYHQLFAFMDRSEQNPRQVELAYSMAAMIPDLKKINLSSNKNILVTLNEGNLHLILKNIKTQQQSNNYLLQSIKELCKFDILLDSDTSANFASGIKLIHKKIILRVEGLSNVTFEIEETNPGTNSDLKKKCWTSQSLLENKTEFAK